MKHIFLGDIHGRTIWKQIVDENAINVFIGDYFDSHERITAEQQCNNFLDIIFFKRKNPDNVILLIGNHDYHYMDIVGEKYSGYQYESAPQIKYLLEDNKDALQMCYETNDFICTHAGISKTWLSNQKFAEGSIQQQINDIWRYTPSKFRFSIGANYSEYGDDITQTPIWIRPNSLSKDGIDKLQIVGHTMVENINHPKGDRANFYMIDCLHNKQYLTFENKEFKIIKL